MNNPKQTDVATLTPRDTQGDPPPGNRQPAAAPEPSQAQAAVAALTATEARTTAAGLAEIARAVNAVMRDVPNIPKNGHNKFHGYAYATESDVLGALRPAMVKHGLIFTPSTVSCRTEVYQAKNGQGTRAYVRVKYTLAHISGAVWPEELFAEGCGEDMQDKAVAKANTSTHKYFLLRFFQVVTGEDPDQGNSSHGNTQAPPPAARRPPPPRQDTAPAAPAQPEPTGQGEQCRQPECLQFEVYPADKPGYYLCGACKWLYPPEGAQQAPPAQPPTGEYKPSAKAYNLSLLAQEFIENTDTAEQFWIDHTQAVAEISPEDGKWLQINVAERQTLHDNFPQQG